MLKDNEVDPAISVAFLPNALADGKNIAAPKPGIARKSLEAQKKGVSAKTMVVTVCDS